MTQLKTSILFILVFLTACNDKKPENQKQHTMIKSDTITKASTVDTTKLTLTEEALFCIDYHEANSWDRVDEKYDYDFQAFSHKNKNYLKRKKRLTNKQVKQMFVGHGDAIDITNIWADEVVSAETADEYLNNNEFYLFQPIISG